MSLTRDEVWTVLKAILLPPFHDRPEPYPPDQVTYLTTELNHDQWTLHRLEWCARKAARKYLRWQNPLAMLQEVDRGEIGPDRDRIGGYHASSECRKLCEDARAKKLKAEVQPFVPATPEDLAIFWDTVAKLDQKMKMKANETR